MAGILAGAMEGAGRAGVQALHTAQQQYGAEQLAQMKIEAEKELQTSLETMRQAGSDRRLDVTETGLNTRQGSLITSTEGIHSADRTSRETEGAATRASTKDIHAADRASVERVSSASNAAQERIHAANNVNSLAIAKLGGTVQQDKDGNIFMLSREGELKPLVDPNTKQQMKGFKDLTPAAKLRAETLKAQLVDLDRAEVAAMGQADQIKAIEGRRADLTRRQLNVLTGVPEDSGKPEVQVPQSAIDDLKKNAKRADEFDAKYGKGAAAKYLGGKGDATAEAEKPKGIINAAMPTARVLTARELGARGNLPMKTEEELAVIREQERVDEARRAELPRYR